MLFFCVEFCDSLCQQLTLKHVVLCIPSVYSDHPKHAKALLMNLLSIFDYKDSLGPESQDTTSALLFEEDKSNSYAEPVQLMEYASLAISKVPNSSELLIDVSSLSLKDDVEVDCRNLWIMKSDQVLNLFKKKYFWNTVNN